MSGWPRRYVHCAVGVAVLLVAGGFPLELYTLSRRERMEALRLYDGVVAPATAGCLRRVEYPPPFLVVPFTDNRGHHAATIRVPAAPTSRGTQLGKLRAFLACSGADQGERPCPGFVGLGCSHRGSPPYLVRLWCDSGALLRRGSRGRWASRSVDGRGPLAWSASICRLPLPKRHDRNFGGVADRAQETTLCFMASIMLHDPRGQGHQDSSGAVLIDNSTYFSAVDLLTGQSMDAYRVFNLANLLECVVISEQIVVSPTQAWQPSNEDVLFSTEGPCRNLTFDGSSDEELGQLFRTAIIAAIRDVESRRVMRRLGYSPPVSQAAARLLRRWRNEAEDDPQNFINQYSGAVYLTDSASRGKVAALPTVTSGSAGAEYHLAQFLLRANVAYNLSARWAYHPHSHRIDYVSMRMRQSNYEVLNLGREILIETESATSVALDARQRESLLREFGAFRHESPVPFVLAAVLSQCRRPEDILPVALEMRDQRSAKRYRRWANEIVTAGRSGDFERADQAEEELRQAVGILNSELSSLYLGSRGQSKSGVVDQVATHIGTLDPGILLEQKWGELAAGETLKAIGQSPRALEWWKTTRRKRNLVFLLQLARQRRSVQSLNSLMQSVFGSALDQDDLAVLRELRARNRRNVAALSAIAEITR